MSFLWFSLGALAGSVYATGWFMAAEIRRHGWRNNR